MKYNRGDIVVVNNDYLNHILSEKNLYHNIAVVTDRDDDIYNLIISRNNSGMYTSGAKIKEQGIIQLLPRYVKIKVIYGSYGYDVERECSINNELQLVDINTNDKLDYMRLANFRIISSYTFTATPTTDNTLLNKLYKALGR